MAEIDQTELENARFYQSMQHLAKKHGCVLCEIDYEAHVVLFEGPEEQQLALAMDLDGYLVH